jgi:hypothetical protein
MLTANNAGERARWEVLWLKDGRVVRKACEHDLGEATRLFALAKTAGRKGVTLRCCNMAFPPPDKYADTERIIVERNGKRYRGKKLIEPRQYQVKMNELNIRGIWWCAYCMQLRRFVKRKRVQVGTVRMDDECMACPICGATHRLVAKWNPMANRIINAPGRMKDPNGRARRRRRRRESAEE